MPYEIYKIIHLTSLVLLFSCIAATFFADQPKKIFKILTGVSTLLVLVSGMGLVARIGISHGAGWPLWLKTKVLLWLLIGVGAPIINKRLAKFKTSYFWICMVLFSVAVALVNYKPE